MGATPQSQAINGANDLLAIMQQLQSARAAADNWLKQYNAGNWSAIWNALATAPANTDGSLGVVDVTPNTAHPIDTRVASQAGLLTPISAANLVNGAAIIIALDAFFTGAAVATNTRDNVLNLFRAG